jgi:hypothetical protein
VESFVEGRVVPVVEVRSGLWGLETLVVGGRGWAAALNPATERPEFWPAIGRLMGVVGGGGWVGGGRFGDGGRR